MKNIDFDEINSTALNCLETLLHAWLPGGRIQGTEFVCGSWNGEPGKSLSINLTSGRGGDFASGEIAGDPIGIYALKFGLDRVTAARALEDELRMNKAYSQAKKQKSTKEESDNVKQKKLDKIISECISLLGTPAQLYLQKRGMNLCNTNIFKFRPHKPSGGGALVCFAIDDNGVVKATQQVYVSLNGLKIDDPWRKKKPEDKPVMKRTNGFPSGNPVRIPKHAGVEEDTPIIVCEGPEDGITLNSATGFETWVACGLVNMDKIPLIQGKQYLIARDNDSPGSPADVLTNRTLLSLIDRGFGAVLCARAPQGVKDANQLLQDVGVHAVVDMINNAMPIRVHNSTATVPHQNSVSFADDDYLNEEDRKSVFAVCSEFEHTDVGNSFRIKERWKNIVKFADGIGWIVYGKGKWVQDLGEYRVLNMAAITAMDIINEIKFCAEHKKDAVKRWSRKSQGGAQIGYALRLSKAHLAIKASEMDKNFWFFNCANGVIDLKTGALLPHNSEYLLTKQSNIPFDPNAKCSVWEKFLYEIFPYDPEIIPFLQRAVGYSLTGDTREQCMFILHGNGSNGKSTFLDTLQGVMADYWIKTKADAFMERERRGSDANPFLAMLRGARFVTASETKSDRSLDEAVVKEATGDSFMTVRNLHQNPITFQPQFKLWLATNHKPEVRGTDEGIWRRLRLIPFKARFYDKDDPDSPEYGPFKDKMLMIKLKAELPGILTWAVKGCLEWQKKGLMPPECIAEATQEYRKEMDIIGTFFEECLEMNSQSILGCNEIYTIYKRWCEENGHFALSKNKLGRRIYERGIEKARTPSGDKAYKGLRIKDSLRTSPNWNNFIY